MWLPEILIEVKLNPQSKPPRGKLAERGVDDPSGPGVAHTRIRLNTTVSRVEEAA